MPNPAGDDIILGAVVMYEQERRVELDLKVKFANAIASLIVEKTDD
jgi:hypothetical protein